MARLTTNERAKPPGSEHISREDAWKLVVALKPALDRMIRGMVFNFTKNVSSSITEDEAYENAQGAAYEGALWGVEAKAPNLGGVEGYMMRSARNAIYRTFEDLLVQHGGDGSHRKDKAEDIRIDSFNEMMVFGPWDEDSTDEERLPDEIKEKISVPGFDDEVNAQLDFERGDTPTQRALRDILTPTQWEVLQMAADGLSINEIAQLREVSRSTVQTHLEDARQRAREALS